MGAAFVVYNELEFGMAEEVCQQSQKGELEWKRFVLNDLHQSEGKQPWEH